MIICSPPKPTPSCERQACRSRSSSMPKNISSSVASFFLPSSCAWTASAQADELPEASVTDGGLKITPLNNQASNEAEMLTRQAYGLVPRIKITDLLTEVDGWCDFGRHFTHLRSRDAVSDRALLLTAILADGINLWTHTDG